MKTTTKNTGIKVNAGVKAGGYGWANNHNKPLKVKTNLKAGILLASRNHNRQMLASA